MLSLRLTLEKDYLDREIQTDSPSSPSHSEALTITKSSKPRNYDSDLSIPRVSRNASKSNIHLTDSAQLEGAYSCSLSSDRFSPAHSAMLPRRMHKTSQLPYSRPSESHSSRMRIVSLPETSPSYSTKAVCEPSTLRVVSMSEHSRPSLSFRESTSSSNCFETSTNTSHFSADDGFGYCQIRALPASSDPPHTPSPPSSPESVVIIGNNEQVPQSFLRHKVESHVSCSDDRGWITWASSPPRPIPALHGPLSLPYARCPSGAEGTIIEGDDLSRMIWGLGDDGSLPAHARTNSHQGAAQKTIHQMAVPRLQKSQMQDSQIRRAPNAYPRPSPVMFDHDRRFQAALRQRTLGNVGSRYSPDAYGGVTSHNISRTGSMQSPGPWGDIYGTQYHTSNPLVDELRTYDREGGLGLDWQATIRGSNLKASRNVEVTNCLKPSAPVFVPANQAPQYPFPRIFVEPRPTERNVNPRPMSHMEAAHRYRKMHQLPTPPSSSSPQWSYYPDLFPLSDLPPSCPSIQQSASTQQHLQDEFSPDLHIFVNERTGKTGFNNVNVTSGTAAHIERPQAVSQRFLEMAPLHSQPSYHRNSNVNIAPPHPGPPSNIPLPPAAILRSTLPEVRTRSLPYQQPRSIPLARLMQRRLSSVPEEGAGSFLEHICSPPPSPAKAQSVRSRAPDSDQASNSQPVKSFPRQQSRSAVNDHNRYTSSPSPVAALLTPQTRTAPGSELGGQIDRGLRKIPVSVTTQATATVKLPLRTINSADMHARGVAGNQGERKDAIKEKENGTKRSSDMVSIIRATPKKKTRGRKNKNGTTDRLPITNGIPLVGCPGIKTRQ